MKKTYAILGGSGHIGSALSLQLLKQGNNVVVIGHSAKKQGDWEEKGAKYEVTDVLDSESLHEIFEDAERIFILNPPADPKMDAEAAELKQVESILKSLQGLSPQKIVFASTYGARSGRQIFDLGTLYQLEEGLKKLEVPLAIIRSAYYMSNFDLPVQMALENGKLSTVLPSEFKLPMVAPDDIASLAAKLLQNERTGTFYLQSAGEYSAGDAARILTEISSKSITTNEIPENKWMDYMQENGFSRASAISFVGMTKLTINEKFEAPDPETGKTTLRDYLTQITKKADAKQTS